jgi:hypothetical protein
MTIPSGTTLAYLQAVTPGAGQTFTIRRWDGTFGPISDFVTLTAPDGTLIWHEDQDPHRIYCSPTVLTGTGDYFIRSGGSPGDWRTQFLIARADGSSSAITTDAPVHFWFACTQSAGYSGSPGLPGIQAASGSDWHLFGSFGGFINLNWAYAP